MIMIFLPGFSGYDVKTVTEFYLGSSIANPFTLRKVKALLPLPHFGFVLEYQK